MTASPATNRGPNAAGRDYARFVILCDGRTGSTMLAQALQSNPQIICFRNVFNYTFGADDQDVDGYDMWSPDDWALRARDGAAFVRERVFRVFPPSVRAVGFKYHYRHVWGYAGGWEAIRDDPALRVIHLKRRNALRTYTSFRIAKLTDAWANDPQRRATVTARLRRGAAALRRLGRPARSGPVRVRIEREELDAFLLQTALRIQRFEDDLAAHPTLEVWYEDLVADRERRFAEIQRFLGVEPASLQVTLSRQNPQPLSELIENYDELRAVFQDTPYAWMFDERLR